MERDDSRETGDVKPITEYTEADLQRILERRRRELQVSPDSAWESVGGALARSSPTGPPRVNPSTTSGRTSSNSSRDTSGMEVLGLPGKRTCEYCGALLKKVVGTWENLSAWRYPEHRCPEQAAAEARVQAAKEAKEAARRVAWEAERREPTASRVATIRQRCQIPGWAPPGLDATTVGVGAKLALAACRRHRDLGISGERPRVGLWIHGRTNARKTTMLGALAFDVANWTGRPVLFWDLADLMREVRRGARRASAGGEGGSEYDDEAAEAAHMLVLDDVGTVKGTERLQEEVLALVKAAQDAWGHAPHQTLYVASNEEPESLGRLLGDRAVRRMLQLCEKVPVG